MRLRASMVALALGAVVLAPLGVAGSAVAKGEGGSYVIQGVPGASVDVSVDGELIQSGVAAKEVLGPLDLAAGEHTVEFASRDWTTETTVDLAAGSHDIVLHWPADAADEPVITVFDNDLGAVGQGEGRLTVAHTAVVPPADILAAGEVLFSNIANGEFVTAEVPADTYSVSVVPTGGGDALLGPVDLTVEAGLLTRVYAVGAPRNQSMDAVVHTLSLPGSGAAPSSVNTGSAGLASPDAWESGALWSGPTAVLLAGGLLLGALTVVLRRRRARS